MDRAAMQVFVGLLFATGALPLWEAWRANHRTSLCHALGWATAAWLAWGILLLVEMAPGQAPASGLRYLALALAGCAGVAVLGARRPGVLAWNFVVLGLLAVLLLPLAEGFLLGTPVRLDTFRLVFLGATLAVGVLNYLPTAFASVALFAGVAYGSELVRIAQEGGALASHGLNLVLTLLVALGVPWGAREVAHRRARPASQFDGLWLEFRDRFGLVWGQRLREQFNRSAEHAGWPVVLRWTGLRLVPGSTLPAAAVQEDMVSLLRALMKRFGSAAEYRAGA